MADEDLSERIRKVVASLPPDTASEVIKRMGERLNNFDALAESVVREIAQEKASAEQAAKTNELAGLLKNPRMNSKKIAELNK